ncbi:MAG: glycoside hydrolase family 25 protein [Lachnospiraceae bacterium]|nr:glycoside hydrolase family 25 protein [Lachnospiraceae bacterium]
MRRRRNGGLLAIVMLFCLMTGFVLGMIVIHTVDEKNSSEKIEALKAELKEAKIEQEKPINVYLPKRKIQTGEIQKNSYIKDNFKIEDGFMAYYNENGEKISHVGVDLSYHNEKVDWDALADSPVEFVMLRCGYRGYTEGGLVVDERFKEYAEEATAHGLKLGVYFFTQAISEPEAVAEADFVIDLIEDYEISYPVAFDTELVSDDEARTTKAELSREELSNICIAFCERIKKAGYYPMVYASENWFRRKLDVGSLCEYDFWAPQYLDENDFLYDFTMWQYTEQGSAPGVEGDCDLNISLVDYASFVPTLREAVFTGGEIGEYSDDIPNITIED